MQAADKRYWEDSEFLLLRNEVALQTLFQDKATAKEDAKETAEPIKAGSTYFEEMGTEEEERVKKHRFTATANVEVDHKAAVEKLGEAVLNGRREVCRTTPFHFQALEDRIKKARLDVSILEQHSRYVEMKMKLLQDENVKLKAQLRRAEVQFNDLLREQQAYLTRSFNYIIKSC